MKILVFVSHMVLLAVLFAGQVNIVVAQDYKNQNTFNKEAELQKFIERGGKVEEISPEIYRLTNRIGESRTFYFSSKENVFENNHPVDTTIINIWEIDTTKFAGMFTFWQQVNVNNGLWPPLQIEDLNNNGRPELYGFTNTILPKLAGPIKIFERNTSGIYQDIFTYDSITVYVLGIANFYPPGNTKIFTKAFVDEDSLFYGIYPVYKTDSGGTLPTTFDFFFYRDTIQINNMVFGDWDYNGITECAFTAISDTPMCVIAEYRDSLNNFEELFRFSSIFDSDMSGFTIDDFDLDNRTELVISSGPGNVFVIENKDENEYLIVNQFPFPIPNTYMQTATRDIDGNGKPEFWVGGQDFENGITILQCYEADGDNNYKTVARIELRYLVSFYNFYIQAVDVDDNGKEELIISIGNVILILKFVGSPDNHQYKLWYAKLDEATQPGAQFYPAGIADLDGDGKLDLIIPMERYTPSIIYNLSYILRQDKPSSINKSELSEMPLEFIHSYPNPFNSESTISFNITETSNVQLKIYNTVGEEINLLLYKELTPGNYNISWDVKDKSGNSLPSGVYLIVLKTKNSVKTFKSLLLK